MSASTDEHAELIERLKEDGYVVGESSSTGDGTLRMLVGDQWMTIPEMEALSSQHDESFKLP